MKTKFFHDFSDRLPNLRHSAQKAPTMCSRRTGIEIILKQEGRSNECPSVEMGSVVAVFECRKARKSNVVELSTRFVRSIVVGHYSEIHCISDIVTMEKVTIVTNCRLH